MVVFFDPADAVFVLFFHISCYNVKNIYFFYVLNFKFFLN